jgi:hypothetical protein
MPTQKRIRTADGLAISPEGACERCQKAVLTVRYSEGPIATPTLQPMTHPLRFSTPYRMCAAPHERASFRPPANSAWMAVALANDRPARRRQSRSPSLATDWQYCCFCGSPKELCRPHAVAALPKRADFFQHRVFSLRGFNVLLIFGEPMTEADVADALPVRPLVLQVSRVRSPLASPSD